MIKMRKGNVIVLGLSEENIKRLNADQPIRFKLSDLIPDREETVYIIAGKTEESISLTLRQMIDSNN